MPELGEEYEAAVADLLARSPAPASDPRWLRTVLELLGRPDRAYPAVRVVGGRGSLARMVAALLAALELKAGCLLSEHLQDPRERVSVAGEPLSPEALAARASELGPFLAEADARFAEPGGRDEALAALAFAHFADAPVDVGVVEAPVGAAGSSAWDAGPLAGDAAGTLAGDAAIDPSALTRGEVVVLAGAGAEPSRPPSLPEGVAEDALVVAPGDDPAAREALARACERVGARLVTVSEDEAVAGRRLAVGGQQLDLRGQTGEFADTYLPLHGREQAANAVLALVAVEGFLGFAGGLDPEVVREGFAAVRAPGRLEVVRRADASTVVLDAARTPSSTQALATALREEFSFRHRVLVVAAEEGADAAGLLAPLLAVAEHVVTTAVVPGQAAPGELAAAARAEGASAEPAGDVAAALELASGVAGEEDGVVVTGSGALVGAARRALGLGVG